MKKLIILVTSLSIITGVISVGGNNKANSKEAMDVESLDFSYDVDPKTFEVMVESNGKKEVLSEALSEREVSNLKKSKDEYSWDYEKENINVKMKKEKEYLDIIIKSNTKEENKFTWPKVDGEGYIMPLNEGKYIPSNDETWNEYLSESEFKGIESLSMQFFSVNKEKYSIMFIIKNPHNNTIKFDQKKNIGFSFTHEYPNINENKEYGFRVYIKEKNPVDIAKTYKNYIIEKGEFKTLDEKSKENKNIEKLYGAPHIYFWDKSVLSEDNVRWNSLKETITPEFKGWIKKLLISKVEDGEELAKAFDDLDGVDYVDKYTKNRILKSFSSIIQLREFYSKDLFVSLDDESKKLLQKGIDKLDEVEIVTLNKRLLKSYLGSAVDPIEKWANSNTVNVLEDMKSSGIDNMWIGLDDWNNGFMNPKLVDKANDLGYLVGTYDSYHSIHKPGEEEWITAKFKDTTLFENATVTNKNGEKIEGFQGVGRKLNPTLAMPSVRERVNSILGTGLKLNSWFLDTDSTGEVYDDYDPKHITTEGEDIAARIERMEYIKNDKNMVIGTEGGNDFANKSIAFAHGIETPAFSWMDYDMSKNKESEYYVGKYYSATGGVPELFSKQIPLKEKYRKLFLDTRYTLPLYKLVYNDSVITTHWWGWGTLKMKDDIKDRMLYEILYNVPPLYHIDKEQWTKDKDEIVKHSNVWSAFSKKAIKKEMTDFKILSNDRMVQMSEYGEDLKVIANFSNETVNVESREIKGKSLIIMDGNKVEEYTP